ncbi:hypothetical protein OF83DRAFT_1050165 [Amylostereum chailletii]|nr:hypothetical protein OF83DRAFT_1050165 [Amylostereum chailletii]
MDPLDTSWCPVCSRQILPKRFLVPVYPSATQPQQAPAPPPSPTSSSPDNAPAPPTRPSRRQGTVRARGPGGLVRGTGRVKPNGTIKRPDSAKDAPAPPAFPSPAPVPIKHRTVIDQDPTPLYCSDECRLADLDSGDFNPNRDPHLTSPHTAHPVSHPPSSTGDDSESTASTSTSSSPDSIDGIQAPDYLAAGWDSLGPSVGALARIYDFPPLPYRPPMPAPSQPEPTPNLDEQYSSGVMMAAARIKEALCPPPQKRSSHGFREPPQERKPIPGWTDGSDAWRASVYSFSSPKDSIGRDLKKVDERPRAYNSFAASPHRSTGVYSTLSENSTPTAPAMARATTSDELLNYPLTFARRTDSRSSMYSGQASSLPVTTRSLVKKGAEGKLLVPNVQLLVRTPSSYSSADTASVSSKSWRSGSTRSPLSRYGSDFSDEEEKPKRPVVETRSWSYDNVPTYDIMPMPKRKEKRYERQVVDGVARTVEVEVEVEPTMKRLFLFPGKEVRH